MIGHGTGGTWFVTGVWCGVNVSRLIIGAICEVERVAVVDCVDADDI